MKNDLIKEAHKKSSRHREEILSSEICGCFYCISIFNPSEIEDWVGDDVNEVGQTALCPKCGIDSVIGSKSGFPVGDKDFLAKMKSYWFG